MNDGVHVHTYPWDRVVEPLVYIYRPLQTLKNKTKVAIYVVENIYQLIPPTLCAYVIMYVLVE